MRVIGTAGHVDHGKSTLVQALTGIDPDRLEEEKARGMTIDLGFAWVELPIVGDSSNTESQSQKKRKSNRPTESQSVGVVDVPGHIDFIKNMLAGVGSIDTVLLVIAADESVMPQTREHLAILDLLAVPAGVVALTKVDLVDDPEWLDLVELDIVELLQETRFADAPIVRVSAASGAGLDELRFELAHTLEQLAPRRNRARPRLPIDRIFSLSGFGTVVTGTLSDGHFAVGDSVEILPRELSARIRGLQTHKQKIETGEPGSRLAMNLSGIGTEQVRRGDVVVKPDTLRSTLLLDVSVRLLPDTPKPLVHNQRIDFFSGAAEIPARVRLLGTEALEPGASGWLQLHLERPMVVAAGDHYILRQPSPSITLGGGVVLSPHPRRRWRRFDPTVLQRLETLSKGAPDEILLQVLTRYPFLSSTELIGQSGLDLQLAEEALVELQASGAILSLAAGKQPSLLCVETWMQIIGQLTTLLTDFHQRAPLRRGLSRSELRNRLQVAVGGKRQEVALRLFNTLIEQAKRDGTVEADDMMVWLADFTVQWTSTQQERVTKVLQTFGQSPFSPPNQSDTLQLLGQDEELLESVIEQGQLVRVSGGVLFRQQDFERMVDLIREHASIQGSITLAQARDLFQTSRKYAQAVLEETDAQRITRRQGDERVLR